MLYAIDGTGPSDNEAYARDFTASFCRRVHLKLGFERSWYWRGPGLSGGGTSVIVDTVFRRVMNDRHCRPETTDQPIHLVGYSRGGLACVEVARRLERQRVPVRALFLFDAVDRCRDIDGSRIPANVEAVYHARRNPKFGERLTPALEAAWRRLTVDGSVALSRLDPVSMPVPGPGTPIDLLMAVREVAPALLDFVGSYVSDQHLRWTTRNRILGSSVSLFGNTALVWERAGGAIDTQHFMGSHGALGGTPWSEQIVPGDKLAVGQVWRWMWERFRREGVL